MTKHSFFGMPLPKTACNFLGKEKERLKLLKSIIFKIPTISHLGMKISQKEKISEKLHIWGLFWYFKARDKNVNCFSGQCMS